MEKLDTLKTHLLSMVPGLKKSPEQIHIFADEGRIKADLENTLSFQYRWQMTIIVEQFHGETDQLFVPLLIWIQQNERDIQRDDIQFLVDPLDNGRADIRITFPSFQSVIVSQDQDGNLTTEHPPEPVPPWVGTFPSLNNTNGRDQFDD